MLGIPATCESIGRMGNALKQRGFSMIEVVLTITVLAILAIVALPNFMALSDQAHTSSRNNVASAVQEGIALWRSQDLVTNGAPGNYPAQLDALANGTICGGASPCFVMVMLNGIADDNWSKVNATRYRYTTSQGVSVDFVYTAASGTFVEQ